MEQGGRVAVENKNSSKLLKTTPTPKPSLGKENAKEEKESLIEIPIYFVT